MSPEIRSSYQAGLLTLEGFTTNLNIGESNPILADATTSLVAARKSVFIPLFLSTPGFGIEGSTQANFDVPDYLQLDWLELGDPNSVGTDTFGRFRSYDRILSCNELH